MPKNKLGMQKAYTREDEVGYPYVEIITETGAKAIPLPEQRRLGRGLVSFGDPYASDPNYDYTVKAGGNTNRWSGIVTEKAVVEMMKGFQRAINDDTFKPDIQIYPVEGQTAKSFNISYPWSF